MFRRSIFARQVRDLGVKFCDGCGVSTRAQRSARRLEAARTSAVLNLPHL